MDDKKTGLVADWPKPIHLDEKWAAWIGAVQQRIEALEAQKLGKTAAECWTRLDELAESAAADNRRRNDEKRRNDSFDGPSARLRHDEGMPSERAPLARSRMLEAEYDAERERIAQRLGLPPSSTSWLECEQAIERLRNTPASELVAMAQNETVRALDLAHATRERLGTVERELATLLKLCADLIEPIDVRRTPAGSEIKR